MKFPSLSYLGSQIVKSFIRFYLPLMFAVLGTVYAQAMVKNQSPENTKGILSCILGLSLSLGAMLYAERSSRPLMKFIAPIMSVVLIVAYWHWLAPAQMTENMKPWIIYLVLAVVMHLWVAVSAYIGKNEKTGFWQFNESLYTRMILSALFSAALFAGLAVALFGCKELLRWDISNDAYLRLWLVIVGIFNTWFFLAGIPNNYAETDTEKPFPKALKIFTQYILMPIVTIYMLILYTYGFQILSRWSLPRGWVSTLILCYGVVGILAVLLVNPLRNSKDNAWVRTFSRFFFIALLPLLVLLYAAIHTRISKYGVTESRYYLLLIGAWLGLISVYFILSPKKNIKLIPVSLGLIGLLSLCGPWSVFSVSNKSQLHRMETILAKKKQTTPKTNTPINMDVYYARQLDDIIDFFIRRDNVLAMQPYFTADLKKVLADTYPENKKRDAYDWNKRYELKRKLLAMICSTPVNDASVDFTLAYRYRFFRLRDNSGISVAGYSKVFQFDADWRYHSEDNWLFLSQHDSIEVTITEKDSIVAINLMRGNKCLEQIPLNDLIKRLMAKPNENCTDAEMSVTGTGPLSPKITIKTINIKDPNNIEEKHTVEHINAWIMLR